MLRAFGRVGVSAVAVSGGIWLAQAAPVAQEPVLFETATVVARPLVVPASMSVAWPRYLFLEIERPPSG